MEVLLSVEGVFVDGKVMRNYCCFLMLFACHCDCGLTISYRVVAWCQLLLCQMRIVLLVRRGALRYHMCELVRICKDSCGCV